VPNGKYIHKGYGTYTEYDFSNDSFYLLTQLGVGVGDTFIGKFNVKKNKIELIVSEQFLLGYEYKILKNSKCEYPLIKRDCS
jgi:hypothetical protein